MVEVVSVQVVHDGTEESTLKRRKDDRLWHCVRVCRSSRQTLCVKGVWRTVRAFVWATGVENGRHCAVYHNTKTGCRGRIRYVLRTEYSTRTFRAGVRRDEYNVPKRNVSVRVTHPMKLAFSRDSSPSYLLVLQYSGVLQAPSLS